MLDEKRREERGREEKRSFTHASVQSILFTQTMDIGNFAIIAALVTEKKKEQERRD